MDAGKGGPDSYIAGLPPPSPIKGEKLQINVEAEVKEVLDIKEIDGVWSVKVTFSMKWLDERLQWQNLKEVENLNVLAEDEKNLLWFPNINFANNDNVESMVRDEKATILVHRNGSGVFTEPELSNADVYEGKENPIAYRRSYSVNLSCDFKLQTYPFDTQQCTIQLRVPSKQEEWVSVRAERLSYVGKVELQQFSVGKIFLRNMKINKEDNAVFVMTFHRKISYHMFSTYLPTITIFTVSLLTLRVPIEHFEASIMVQLTSMLVMYTLFQATAGSLPKVSHHKITSLAPQTAYIKMIDGWLLYGLLLPFFGFLLTVFQRLTLMSKEEVCLGFQF